MNSGHFQENIDYAKEQSELAVKEKVKEKKELTDELTDEVIDEGLKNSIEEMDPWLKNKEG